MPMCETCKRDRESVYTIELNEVEKEQLRKHAGSQKVPDRLHYCQPCRRVMSHPVYGPELAKGLFLRGLQRLGVEVSEQRANSYREWLAQTAQKQNAERSPPK
jgi:hypothetical protein